MRIIQGLIILITIGIVAVGCSSSDGASDDNEGLKLYASVYPIQYAIERIGGQTVTVESVYPPGVDAHTYEPTSKDMTSIANSDAFMYMGAGMEGFAETAAEALATQDVRLVEIGQQEELFHTDEPEKDGNADESDNHSHDGHNHGDHDPHIWIDPQRMIDMAAIIRDELIDLNPDQAELYNDNFNTLEKDLIELDENYNETLQANDNKKILVSHAAYGYWEERYGIEQIAINGLSSSNEPSQKELTQIIDQAEKHNLDYIIFEQNSSNRVSEIIQEQIGTESLTIHNLSVLTDTDIENNEDYLSLMEKNLEILNKATSK
ncbi:zinc ABC transporter substrate-binding protein [Virgibacillus sp. NKC19-3]|uniref:metal ABC transporter solute-binding protein, Zn/Mn family n=1 Tax=Virgibacillus saliphilus TaxID=2831674 RepID=UPI001C9A8A28|nr:zinc ABC transporter substrate-binding protein [Virgibacillus sp. NKC19-3]MBY7144018.1 zinc ABC transporter substrate-binding protein [Virgibacillus sp. NKC19-3]